MWGIIILFTAWITRISDWRQYGNHQFFKIDVDIGLICSNCSNNCFNWGYANLGMNMYLWVIKILLLIHIVRFFDFLNTFWKSFNTNLMCLWISAIKNVSLLNLFHFLCVGDVTNAAINFFIFFVLGGLLYWYNNPPNTLTTTYLTYSLSRQIKHTPAMASNSPIAI